MKQVNGNREEISPKTIHCHEMCLVNCKVSHPNNQVHSRTAENMLYL